MPDSSTFWSFHARLVRQDDSEKPARVESFQYLLQYKLMLKAAMQTSISPSALPLSGLPLACWCMSDASWSLHRPAVQAWSVRSCCQNVYQLCRNLQAPPTDHILHLLCNVEGQVLCGTTGAPGDVTEGWAIRSHLVLSVEQVLHALHVDGEQQSSKFALLSQSRPVLGV